jgi:hypothetical protein
MFQVTFWGIGTIGNNSLGLNARLSLVSIANTSQLILDNVQGDFITGTGNTVRYINSTGLTTDLNGANNAGGNVVITDIDVVNSGLNIVVNHKNHGMYFTDNYATLSKVQSDLLPTKLVNDLEPSTTGDITVDSATNFDEFENVGVGTTNYGYLKIGEELFLMRVLMELLSVLLQERLILQPLRIILLVLQFTNMNWVVFP